MIIKKWNVFLFPNDATKIYQVEVYADRAIEAAGYAMDAEYSRVSDYLRDIRKRGLDEPFEVHVKMVAPGTRKAYKVLMSPRIHWTAKEKPN